MFIERSNAATSIEELFALFESEMLKLGYDRVLLALMTDHPHLQREAEHGILKNYPESWVKHYLDAGYDRIDPVRNNIFSRLVPFSWQELIEQNQLSPKQRRMFNEAEEEGLLNGVAAPLRGPGGTVAGIGAASSTGGVEVNPAILDMVNLLSYQFYTCFCRLLAKHQLEPPIQLSEREQEILKWCAHGYTKSEIGDKLCISLHTVDYHVRNSLRKLEARNITAAVVQALHRGLIQL